MNSSIRLRLPTSEDGYAIYDLVKNCPPLDPNSLYCNLLQATHFANTSVAAELNGKLVGFISGYIVPDQPNTLFIWQVAVSEEARGKGLAKRMVQELLDRPTCSAIQKITTTITESNQASWSLFRKIAEHLKTELIHQPYFLRESHFRNLHETEHLITIGTFSHPSDQTKQEL